MRRARIRPGFLFVGTGRAGSNWVFEVLREHPEVFLPANKGTFFFNRFFELGVDWYESFFSGSVDEKVAGEVCEDYLSNELAIERIHEYRQDMRLICCFRNPYERAISHWRFFARNGLEEPTITAQGNLRPDVYYLGYYATQLRHLRSVFSQQQILVYLYDDLVSSAEGVARAIYNFIGVDPYFLSSSLSVRVNASDKPRFKLFARFVHNVHMHSWGRSRVVSNFVGAVKRVRPLRKMIKSLLYKSTQMEEGWLDYLTEFPDEIIIRFEEEISALECMLNRNLSNWRAPHEIVELARRRYEAEISDAGAQSGVSGALCVKQ